jgi:hypothetical protein
LLLLHHGLLQLHRMYDNEPLLLLLLGGLRSKQQWPLLLMGRSDGKQQLWLLLPLLLNLPRTHLLRLVRLLLVLLHKALDTPHQLGLSQQAMALLEQQHLLLPHLLLLLLLRLLSFPSHPHATALHLWR